MIKRKRSESELSATLSSPLRASFQTESVSPFTRDPAPSHLCSRTRKRHRDNRPDENRIHEHTMSLLYAAQRHPIDTMPSPTPSHAAPQSHPPQTHNHNHNHQASLHSFWPLPSKAAFSPQHSSTPTSNSTTSEYSNLRADMEAMNAPTHCEDCETPLVRGDDDMDVDMDVDVDAGVADLACSACGKRVCHRCAVSNLGAQRRCLFCAGRRVWVGGLGWVDN